MNMMQVDLFGEQFTEGSISPAGFRYSPDTVPTALQDELLAEITRLPLKPFKFSGYEGKRKVMSFGWKFDFERQCLVPAGRLPEFLLPIRDLAAKFAGTQRSNLQQALVTEYGPGAPIGWHRDKQAFGRVVGVSLLSRCTLRLRRRMGSKWERYSVTAEPGSMYLLAGSSRSDWEHSIPPVENLRYSITFRELA